ncbi:MAG: DUF4394 domain-containing protein [Solirubrobacteraceae bacterium]
MLTPRSRAVSLVVALICLAAAPAAHAVRLVALGESSNTLYHFDSATPGTIIGSPVVLSGLNAGEFVYGIDVRPATGELYGVTSQSHVVTINALSGATTTISSTPFSSGLSWVGMDFNPVADRIRVVDDTGKNLRINPDDGTFVVDATLSNIGVSGAAYSNPFSGATATTLYDLDFNADLLEVQNPPNNGTLSVVGVGLGVDMLGPSGFDIAQSGVAYAELTVGGLGRLYTINLAAGTATLVGTIGGGLALDGLAVLDQAPSPVRVAVPSRVLAEGSGSSQIVVRRIGGSTHLDAVTVDVTIAEGTATRPTDFVTGSSTLTFAAGETTKNITVQLADDAVYEGNEFFQLSLSNARSSVSGPVPVGSPATTIIGITDDDAAPVNTGPTGQIGPVGPAGPIGAAGPSGQNATTLFVALARARTSIGRRARLRVPYVANAAFAVKAQVLQGVKVLATRTGTAKVGRNALAFAKKKRFKPGRYTLRLTATSGAASAVDTAVLVVKKG